MNKRIIYLFIGFLSVSCSENIDLNGNWIIMEMQYKGESVYPNTISNGFSVQLNIVGYEGAEKITFQSLDSTIVLPGFDFSGI